ncbi:MAG: hypothetical protein ACRD26_20480 [Vicinamibacterales bacterium]
MLDANAVDRVDWHEGRPPAVGVNRRTLVGALSLETLSHREHVGDQIPSPDHAVAPAIDAFESMTGQRTARQAGDHPIEPDQSLKEGRVIIGCARAADAALHDSER